MGTQNSWNNQIAAANSAITLNSGTNAVNISTDASATTLSIGTGGAVKGLTLGSTNSTSASTLQSGSGALNVTATGGALTINSGTGTIGISTDASATTCNFATGGAVKTVQLGTTNTTSATVIKSGSGNIAMNNGLTVDSTGIMTNAVQPSFLAALSAVASNVTGNNTYYYIINDTEKYDIGNNYNNGTGIYTAPKTGKYIFYNFVYVQGCTICTGGFAAIETTARYYYVSLARAASASNFAIAENIVADMTAGDTAKFAIQAGGEAAKTDDLY
jgi:hypothetical protein